MGNRAVIAWHGDKPTDVGIYLHWNGGPESVLAFLAAARQLGVAGDDYGLARLTQIIGNFFSGTSSLGVGQLKTLDCDNGDNGTYVVGGDWEISMRKHTADPAMTLAQLSPAQQEKYRKMLDEVLAISIPIFERA